MEEERVGGADAVAHLVAWAKAQGAVLSDAIHVEEHGRAGPDPAPPGAMHVRDGAHIESGARLFAIPERMLLRTASPGRWSSEALMAAEGPVRDAARKLCAMPPRDQLTVRLLLESLDAASPWAPYVASLPKADPCLSSWDQESLQALRGTPIWKSTRGFTEATDILGDPAADVCALMADIKAAALDDQARAAW